MIRKVINKNSKKLRLDMNGYLYLSIQEALDDANPGDIVDIEEGCYEEKIEIRTSNITIRGSHKKNCKITFSDHAYKLDKHKKPYGTFRTYTFLVFANQITLENLTIENSAGDGRKVGQAIALYLQGDQIVVNNCILSGHQDTLFVGPLPPKPMTPGSFDGPSVDSEYQKCRHYFNQCKIIGDVDYIFGSALALFHNCELITRNRNEATNGYVCAPSTWQQEPYGFVFIASTFIGDKDIAPGSVFFGRPWREFGQVMLVDCLYDKSIHKDHWDHWNKESNKKTARFSEYGCKKLETMTEDYTLLNTEINSECFVFRTKEKININFLDLWHQQQLKP